MKKVLWIASLLALLAAGCVKVEQNLVIRENGSGTLDLRYSIAEQTVAQINAMHKLRGEIDEARGETNAVPQDFSSYLFDPQYDSLAAKLKEYAALGVATEILDIKTRDVRRNVHVKLRFDNLEALARTDLFQAYGFSLQKTAQGQYILDREPGPAPESGYPDFSDAETARMISPFLAGFYVSFSISLPGRIVESTGNISGQYTTSWKYEFERNVDALIALRNQRFRVVFENDGVTLPEIQRPAAK